MSIRFLSTHTCIVISYLVLDSRPEGCGLEPHHVLWSSARHIYPSLVQVRPRKTRSYITERLLMGRKESNRTNKQIFSACVHFTSNSLWRSTLSLLVECWTRGQDVYGSNSAIGAMLCPLARHFIIITSYWFNPGVCLDIIEKLNEKLVNWYLKYQLKYNAFGPAFVSIKVVCTFLSLILAHLS